MALGATTRNSNFSILVETGTPPKGWEVSNIDILVVSMISPSSKLYDPSFQRTPNYAGRGAISSSLLRAIEVVDARAAVA